MHGWMERRRANGGGRRVFCSESNGDDEEEKGDERALEEARGALCTCYREQDAPPHPLPRQICTHYPPAAFPLPVLLRLFLVRGVKREKIDGEQLEVELRQKEKSDHGRSLPSSRSLLNADKGPLFFYT